METVYYHLNVRRVKVSGGADLVSFVPVAAPAGGGERGEVLDFARCRQRLETKAAWRELTLAAQEAPQEPEPAELSAAPATPSRRERASAWLELCASAVTIAVGVTAVIAFLRLI